MLTKLDLPISQQRRVRAKLIMILVALRIKIDIPKNYFIPYDISKVVRNVYYQQLMRTLTCISFSFSPRNQALPS